MRTKNCSLEDLQKALNIVNKQYENNVEFKRLDNVGKNFIFTLRVKSSKGKGAKLGWMTNEDGEHRKTCSACWHVHGNFFEALFSINPEAKIISLGKEINQDQGNWHDWNIGSIMQPYYYSEACNC